MRIPTIRRRYALPLLAVAILAVFGGGAWIVSAVVGTSHADHFDLASLPDDTLARYRFVESHPAAAERIPCYCGCGKALGHTSLKDCYLKPGGYSDHAAACLICGRIASDLERMLGEGQDIVAIRSTIDATYSEFGPPTRTP